MALPHYSQDQTSKKGKQFEPVMANLFEVTILPPAGVNDSNLLLQHVNSISGLELIPSGGGVNEVMKNGKLIFSKIKEERFPELDEIKQLLENTK